jgi:ferredoxin--NADP+ reductase
MRLMSSESTVNAPALPDAKMHLARPTEPVTGTVVSTRICMKGKSASFIRHVAIDVSGTPLAGNFLVGQSFGVIAPGEDANGKPHKVRLYSIASPSWGEDGEGNVLSTTPKRVLDERTPQRPTDDPEDHSLLVGVCSNYLCDLRVGDKVQVTGPNGKSFILPADPGEHDYLFVATGTGIAPFRGMVMELLDREPVSSQIHLVMGAPYTGDLLYDDLFNEYAEKHENFHYHTAISRERRPDGRRGLYVDAYVDEMMDSVFGPLLSDPRTLIYVCGLAGMQVGLFQVLARQGHIEAYLNIKDEEMAAADPATWEWDKIKRFVRPTKRCMLEVY